MNNRIALPYSTDFALQGNE